MRFGFCGRRGRGGGWRGFLRGFFGCGGGCLCGGGAAFGLEEGEFAAGAAEVEAITGVAAEVELEGGGFVGFGAEGEGEADGVVDFADVGGDGVTLLVHARVEEGGFDAPEAAEAPGVVDDFLDQEGFVFGLGVEFGEEGGGEGLEAGAVFGGEEGGFGGEAVGEGVEGDEAFAGGEFGAAGLGAVTAGGFGMELGDHLGSFCPFRGVGWGGRGGTATRRARMAARNHDSGRD